MKIISYNLNGVRAATKNGLVDFIKSCDADFYCFQETRATNDVVRNALCELGYNVFSVQAEKSGYSGVAILSKNKPMRVLDNFCVFDNEGRVVAIEFDSFVIVSLYVPNGATRLEFKLLFLEKFLRECKTKLFGKKDVVVCTDFNISYSPLDLSNPSGCKNSTGYLPVEREAFSDYLNAGFVDAFRDLHPFSQRFTWSSYGAKKVGNQIGNLYTFDYIFLHGAIAQKLKIAKILYNVGCSDHYPVLLEVDNG